MVVCRGNKSKAKSPTKQPDDEESEGLALLIPDIQLTAAIVNSAVSKFQEKSGLFCYAKFVKTLFVVIYAETEFILNFYARSCREGCKVDVSVSFLFVSTSEFVYFVQLGIRATSDTANSLMFRRLSWDV